MFDRNSIPRSPAGSDNEARRFINIHETIHPARRPMPERPVQQVRAAADHFKGEYNPLADYVAQDVVVIRAGSNMGTFVCIQANSAQAPQLPDTGNLYWVCTSNSQAQWM